MVWDGDWWYPWMGSTTPRRSHFKSHAVNLYITTSYYSRRRVLHQEDIRKSHSTMVMSKSAWVGCLGLTHGSELLSYVGKSLILPVPLSPHLFFFFSHFFIFETERETEHEQGGRRERETQNRKQAPGSELSAQSPTRGSNSQTVRSWPEPKSDAQPAKPPRRPLLIC